MRQSVGVVIAVIVRFLCYIKSAEGLRVVLDLVTCRQSPVRVLQVKHVVHLHWELGLRGRGDDAELDHAVELLAEVAATVKSDDMLSTKRLWVFNS